MGISILPNQALAFNIDNSNKCNSNYLLPVQTYDNINLQGLCSESGGLAGPIQNRVPNGDFGDNSSWTLGAGWHINAGRLLYADDGGTATSLPLGLIRGSLYRFYCEVSVITPYTADPTLGIIIKLNDEYIKLPGVAPGNGTTQSFAVTQFYFPSIVTTDVVEFSLNHDFMTLVITNVEITQFSTPAFGAFDFDGNYITTIDRPGVPYRPSAFSGIIPDYNSAQDKVHRTRFKTNLFFDKVPSGCYYLGAFDASANVLDGNFNDQTNWQLGAGWSFGGNRAINSPLNFTNTLRQPVQFFEGQQYTLKFNLQFSTAAALKVEFVTQLGTITFDNIIGNGYKSFTFTAPNVVTGANQIGYLQFTARPNLFGLTGLSIGSVAIISGEANISNNITLQETFPYTTMLFTATNNDNAFNFDYTNAGGVFTHHIRVWGKSKYRDYSEEKDEYQFSNNQNLLLTASVTKLYEVTIGDAAEFVHDCLQMMRLHDTFTLNGDIVVPDGTYALKQRKSTELSQATFNVKPQLGISKNWANL